MTQYQEKKGFWKCYIFFHLWKKNINIYYIIKLNPFKNYTLDLKWNSYNFKNAKLNLYSEYQATQRYTVRVTKELNAIVKPNYTILILVDYIQIHYGLKGRRGQSANAINRKPLQKTKYKSIYHPIRTVVLNLHNSMTL